MVAVATAARMTVVVALEGELDERLAVAGTEPAVDAGSDHDHSEAADGFVVELEERRLHSVERVLVPQLGLDDVPVAAERGVRLTR
jgi:hypothetical protein